MFRYCKICLILVLFSLLTVQCASIPNGDSSPTPTLTQQLVFVSSSNPVQVVSHSWAPDDLLARSEEEKSDVWSDGDELTFFYQGKADEVEICCGVQLPMQRVGDSDFWVLTVHIEDLSAAAISYFFIPYQDGYPVVYEENPADVQVWRGPDAPVAPERAETLQGQIIEHIIDSTSLDESRNLTVYLPPNHDQNQRYPVVYAADGGAVIQLASILDPQIVDGRVPAVIVVGVHSAEYEGPAESYDPHQDLRAQEYLLAKNQERFEAHEHFFVFEVSDWAEQTLGASRKRDERAVFGFSNGGGFAVSMGIRHPDHYGIVLGFSLAGGQNEWGTPEWDKDSAPRHYLVAGTLESFRTPTANWAARLSRLGVEYVHRERVCGHDILMWEEEFPGAVAWAFQDR